MMKPIYILSASAISPQHSFDTANFLQPVMSSDNNNLFVQDPDYTKFISPVAIRRMSRLIKMGISAGMKSLQDAGVTTPDCIITGTGRGSMNDTERFLTDMIQMNEEALNPTFFIQSTYNSINGWLAMQSKCTGYNQTFVHRGFSFEWALMDAQMMLNEAGQPTTILTGCFDELTDDYFLVKSKVNYWKKSPVNSLELLGNAQTNGTIAGEGVAFFTLSNEKHNAACAITAIKMLQNAGDEEINQAVTQILTQNKLAPADIDMVITGHNGDAAREFIYAAALKDVPEDVTIISFKHLCGEYDSSTGFALWLANYIATCNEVPEICITRQGLKLPLKNIILINHYILNSVSIILLQIPQ